MQTPHDQGEPNISFPGSLATASGSPSIDRTQVGSLTKHASMLNGPCASDRRVVNPKRQRKGADGEGGSVGVGEGATWCAPAAPKRDPVPSLVNTTVDHRRYRVRRWRLQGERSRMERMTKS